MSVPGEIKCLGDTGEPGSAVADTTDVFPQIRNRHPIDTMANAALLWRVI